MGYEVGWIASSDRSEHKQAVKKGGDEGAEDDLIHDVAHEGAQQAWAKLGGHEGEGDERKGEHETGNGDHRAGDRAKYGSRTFGATGVSPSLFVKPIARDVCIDGDGCERHRDGTERHEERDAPEAGTHSIPNGGELDLHGFSTT
jgi:hypothetical protein